tara:strand:- start:1057 stop:2949 length:1893 start_codon:yes stop_codon:yes gene_type:complete
MSLVITSNVGQENNPEFSNAFKPYSYQNRLLNTMRIPPNSEIALQSAKINKNGLFILDRTNADFCHYFGVPIGTDATKLAAGEEIPDLDSSTSQPFRGTIGAGAAFGAGGKNERNIEDMANDLQAGVDACAFHPSLIRTKGASFESSIKVTPEYDGTSLAFKGFKFVSTQEDSALTTRLAADITWTDVSKNNAYGFTQNAGVVETVDTEGFLVQNREFPIAQNGGTCGFDVSQTGTSSWMCGLSRINKPMDIGAGDFSYLPPYFDITKRGNNPLASGRHIGNQFRYADFAVAKSGTDIRVFQTGSDSGSVGRPAVNGIYMNEIIYYGAHNTDFPAAPAVAAQIDKVRFTLNNEDMMIEVYDNVAKKYLLLADNKTLAAAGAAKNECLNPVNAAEWAMYPVCACKGTAAANRSIKLESITHYPNYPIYTDNLYDEYDWWGWSQQNNETVFCRELEQRPFNDASNATQLPAKGIDAKGMKDYSSVFITAKSVAYGNSTNECSSSLILGYKDQPVSVPVATSAIITTNESSSVPKLVSNISLFIRLNNFTQNSVNARQGTTSKIVAHLPRFDNSGNETGGLYFEPHEKTYLALGNTEELLVNSFDVDFVYENETLCTALTAKSVVCFHIRQRR